MSIDCEVKITKQEEIDIVRYANCIIAPSLFFYVSWIIDKSVEQDLKRLYFLARDGYVLKEIAVLICKNRGLDIEIRYLFVSRYALRAACLGIISKTEVLEYIGHSSQQVSVDVILSRCYFDDKQKESLIIDEKIISTSHILTESEREGFINQLSSNGKFWEFISLNSGMALEQCVNYFNQEGLFSGDVSIIDSGWSGSIQRNIRQILENSGIQSKISGFYFGMYVAPKVEDGTYYTYYFSWNTGFKRKVHFNNNLFECMLSAPHGMTKGYEKNAEKIVPILSESRAMKEIELVLLQIESIKETVDSILQNKIKLLSERSIYTLMKRAMLFPKKEESLILGEFYFSDDATEHHMYPLAHQSSIQNLLSRTLPVRILRKFSKGRFGGKYIPFIWYYGSLPYVHWTMRWFFRWNEVIGECLRLIHLGKSRK